MLGEASHYVTRKERKKIKILYITIFFFPALSWCTIRGIYFFLNEATTRKYGQTCFSCIVHKIARIDNEGCFLVRTASKLLTQLSHCDCQLCSAWWSLFSEPVRYCQSTEQFTNLSLWGIRWKKFSLVESAVGFHSFHHVSRKLMWFFNDITKL